MFQHFKQFLFLFLFGLFTHVLGVRPVSIGVVIDGPEEKNHLFFQQVEEEIKDLLRDEFKVTFVVFEGNWDVYESRKALFDAFSDPKIDLVLTLGVLPSYIAMHEPHIPKPVILGFDINLITEKPPGELENIAYFVGRKSLLVEIKTFEELTGVKNIAVVGDESLIGLQNFDIIRDKIDAIAKEISITPIFIPGTNDPETIMQSIEISKAEAVIFLPLWRMGETNLSYLIEGINYLKLPSFSMLGENEVEQGVLMTMTPKSEVKRAARRLALNVQEVLLTGSTKDIDTPFFRTNELIINESTAKKIGIDLPWDIISTARFIAKVKTREIDHMNLWEAAETAVKQNLDLETERFVVKSGRENVIKALSSLLPQLDVHLKGRIIDTNSARFSFGREPEKLMRGTLKVNQLLYDERALADHTIERYLQGERIYEKDSLELDIILNTSVTYLLVLRTKAEKQIEEENLALTKANLKRAHELVQSGQARLSEVYRWESELATNLESIVTFQARLENIQTEFNRLLNRPLMTSVLLRDIDPFDPDFIFDYGSLSKLIKSPLRLVRFKEFMIKLSQENSPDLKVLDKEILARSRDLTATKRAFYLPQVSAFGEFANNLYKSGAGNAPPPGVSNAKLESAVGINLSYPLYTSGARKADKDKAQYELYRFHTEKASLTERIDESVIQSIDVMKASYENIFHAKKASEAGEKNLVIVTNSYVRGVISIVDLLDAQNTAIVAKQNFSNAIYDYLIDFMQFQRSISQYDYYLKDKDKMTLLTKLIDWIEEK